MADESIILRIDLDSAELNKQTRKALRALEAQAERSGGRVRGTLGKTFTGIGNQLTDLKNRFAGLFTGIAIIQATRALARFEQQLVAVAKTTGFTQAQIARFSDEILELSKRIPVTTDELLRIAEIAGQLGINGTDNLAKFTETVARLSNSVSGVEADELALQLARITELTGESIGDVDRLGSALVQLGNNFAVNEGQIARTSLEVAKIAGIYDLSSAQVLGLSTALAQSGVQAEVARTTFLKLTDAFGNAVTRGGRPLQEFAKQLGVSTEEFQNLVRNDPTETVLRFIRSLADSSEGAVDLTQQLRNLGLSEIRVRSGISALVNTVDSLEDALRQSEQAFDENTALLEESEQAFNTFGKQLRQTTNIITAFGKSFADDLLPPLTEFLRNLNELLRGNLSESTRQLIEFGKALAQIAVQFAALKALRFLPAFAANIRSVSTVLAGFITGKNGLLSFVRVLTRIGIAGPIAAKAIRSFGRAGAAAGALISKSNVAFFATSVAIERIVSALNRTREQDILANIAEQGQRLVAANEELERLQANLGRVQVLGSGANRVVLPGPTQEDVDRQKENIAVLQASIVGLANSFNQLNAPADEGGVNDNPLGNLPQNTQNALEETAVQLESGQNIFSQFGGFLQNTFKQIADGINNNVKFTAEQLQALDQALKNVIAQGISNTIDAVVTALANGEDGFKAFVDNVGLLIADLATTLGNFFIAAGIAQLKLTSLDPTGTIAAGVALVALGSLLRAVFSGGDDEGGAAVPTSDTITEDAIEVIDPEDVNEPQGAITINVEGTIVNPRETGLIIADLLKDVQDSNDIVTVNV
jgi:TP901 family phage tail tape measure protein